MAKNKAAAAPAADDVTRRVNGLLDNAVRALNSPPSNDNPYGYRLAGEPVGKTIQLLDREGQALMVVAALDRLADLEAKLLRFSAEHREAATPLHGRPGFYELWDPHRALVEFLSVLLRRTLPLDEAAVIRLANWPANSYPLIVHLYPLSGIATAIENRAAAGGLSPALAEATASLVSRLPRDKICRKVAGRLAALLAGGRSPA